MNLEEKQLTSEYIYKGKIIKLRRDTALLPNGKTSTREVIEHNGGVCVVPLTPENEVLMVEQFRYPYGAPVLEIPAGKRDSKTEPPLDCGRRELREETGSTAEHMTFLGELYPTPGYCGEIIYMYLAQGLTYGQTDPDEDEFLELCRTPFDKMLARVMRGDIEDAKTVCGILKVHALRTAQKEKEENEN